jgi:putative membrane protein
MKLLSKIDPRTFLWAVLALEILLGISPKADRFTWALENAPVWIGILVFLWTYKRFPLTNLCYFLLFVHAVILMVGGHYSYAKVPLFNWIRDVFDLSRNNYDRLGHFAQGFIPAILVRELLLRTSPLQRGRWLFYLCVCVCLAFSAAFEMFEWLIAVLSGEENSTAYLATQGDVWDSHWDMLWATIGAITSLLLLSKVHDRELKQVEKKH